jgi:hypothetical protein
METPHNPSTFGPEALLALHVLRLPPDLLKAEARLYSAAVNTLLEALTEKAAPSAVEPRLTTAPATPQASTPQASTPQASTPAPVATPTPAVSAPAPVAQAAAAPAAAPQASAPAAITHDDCRALMMQIANANGGKPDKAVELMVKVAGVRTLAKVPADKLPALHQALVAATTPASAA